jgi:hypothetical protein
LQIAFPTAIFAAVPFRAAILASTARAYALRVGFGTIGLVIFRPPLDSTGVAAKPPAAAASPLRLKLYAAVRAYLLRAFLALQFFPPFLGVIYLTAAVVAKASPSTSFAGLFHTLAAFGASIHLTAKIPLGVVVLHTAFAAAVFLSGNVTRWLERFSAA